MTVRPAPVSLASDETRNRHPEVHTCRAHKNFCYCGGTAWGHEIEGMRYPLDPNRDSSTRFPSSLLRPFPYTKPQGLINLMKIHFRLSHFTSSSSSSFFFLADRKSLWSGDENLAPTPTNILLLLRFSRQEIARRPL